MTGTQLPLQLQPRPRANIKHLQNPNVMPRRTRRDDYSTSRAGAAKVALRAGTQHEKLLRAYERAGWVGRTDEQAARDAGIPMTACYWKRCGELRKLGYINIRVNENGVEITATSSAGVQRIVCALTALGSDVLREFDQSKRAA